MISTFCLSQVSSALGQSNSIIVMTDPNSLPLNRKRLAPNLARASNDGVPGDEEGGESESAAPESLLLATGLVVGGTLLVEAAVVAASSSRSSPTSTRMKAKQNKKEY